MKIIIKYSTLSRRNNYSPHELILDNIVGDPNSDPEDLLTIALYYSHSKSMYNDDLSLNSLLFMMDRIENNPSFPSRFSKFTSCEKQIMQIQRSIYDMKLERDFKIREYLRRSFPEELDDATPAEITDLHDPGIGDLQGKVNKLENDKKVIL